MRKNHSGQAPTLLVLIWDTLQFWPCHTNTLGLQKSLAQEFLFRNVLGLSQQYFVGYIDGFQAEEASFLLIQKVIFLSECHTNTLSLPIYEAGYIEKKSSFCCWFPLFDNWKQLRLMLCLLALNTYNLKLYFCHTNTVFLRMAKSYFGISCRKDP